MPRSSRTTTYGELVAAVAGAEGILGQLCSAFQSIGMLAKSNYQVWRTLIQRCFSVMAALVLVVAPEDGCYVCERLMPRLFHVFGPN